MCRQNEEVVGTTVGLPRHRQRLWLYNDAPRPLVAFYDKLGIRRTYSRLKPPASSRGSSPLEEICEDKGTSKRRY